jgi:hypothetical protein
MKPEAIPDPITAEVFLSTGLSLFGFLMLVILFL